MRTRRSDRLPAALNAVSVGLPLAFLALFFLWPVVGLLWKGLGGNGGAWVEAIGRGSFGRVLWFTTWQAATSVLLTFVIAAPLTWAVANVAFRGRSLVRALVTIPFVLPTTVVVAAFVALSNRFSLEDGPLPLRQSVWAILAAHVFFNVAVVVRSVGSYWSQLDRRPEQVARSLGASPWRAFREVTLSRLRPALLAAASLVFLFTFTSFAIVLLLGGIRRRSLETEIYRYAVDLTDISTAAAISTVQVAAVVALAWINVRLQRKVSGDGLRSTETRRTTRRERALAYLAVAFTTVLLGLPVWALVERSLKNGGEWTLVNYRSLSERVNRLPIDALSALWNSLGFAVTAAGIALLVGGLASLGIVHGRRVGARLLELGMLLPLGVSAVTLGFGILITLDEPPLDLRASWWIVPITQALIGIPFVIRSTVPTLRAISDRQREAASVLGAGPARVAREIDLPVAARALSTGLAFAFAVSLGEFGATSFVGRDPESLTVPLAIARLVNTPGELLRGQAMALSVILMVMTAATVLVVDRAGRGSAAAL